MAVRIHPPVNAAPNSIHSAQTLRVVDAPLSKGRLLSDYDASGISSTGGGKNSGITQRRS